MVELDKTKVLDDGLRLRVHKGNLRIYELNLGVFNVDVLIAFDFGIIDEALEITNDHNKDDRKLAGLSSILTFANGGKAFAVEFGVELPKVTEQLVAHEALHAAYKILHFCRVEHTFENHEVLAYTTDFIVKNAHTALKHEKSIKRKEAKS